MKVTDMTNLFVGYNETDQFRILICAADKEEAEEIARDYRNGSFVVSEFTDAMISFDCDYVLMKG